jgi:clan AA aspartic protease
MIVGLVNDVLQPRIRLDLQGLGARQQVEAIIDTGFNGFLTLPASLIAEMKLPWLYRHHGELADGSIQIFDVHEATIVWNGMPRSVEAEAIDSNPLLGMSLMIDHELRIEVRPGGQAAIRLLTST